jgi:hypothetical protein
MSEEADLNEEYQGFRSGGHVSLVKLCSAGNLP